ncbi:MAG TPA: hypothetical protein VF642_03550 [Propionibacteriaceae bacterium]
MTEQLPPPPVTGHADIDRAMADLADLDEEPLSEHHERLARAQAVLYDVLHAPDQEQPGHDQPDQDHHEQHRARDQSPRP